MTLCRRRLDEAHARRRAALRTFWTTNRPEALVELLDAAIDEGHAERAFKAHMRRMHCQTGRRHRARRSR